MISENKAQGKRAAAQEDVAFSITTDGQGYITNLNLGNEVLVSENVKVSLISPW